MLRIATATVTEVIATRPGYTELGVQVEDSWEFAKAIAYLHQLFQPGDRVLLNTTAVRLGLGTGGAHFVVAKLPAHHDQAETDVLPNRWGHIMKLRYSPCQLAVDSVEEQGSPYHQIFTDESLSLEQTPVLIGELHSLLPAVVAACKQRLPHSRIVYVMLDGASLPIALSRQVRLLRERDLLAATVTTGHAWGGDFEAVTIYSGLLAAKHVAKADIICCFLGPGVAGTGTPLGFSGMQLAEVIHAVSLLDGIPIFIPRISFADPRERHRGISHHSRTVLKRFALRPTLTCLPRFFDARDEWITRQCDEDQLADRHVLVNIPAVSLSVVSELGRIYQLVLSTMGRSLSDDPAPFQTAVSAADIAVRLRSRVNEQQKSGEPFRSGARDILAALASSLTSDGA